jgi:uncharacterized protein (DUF1684 family)
MKRFTEATLSGSIAMLVALSAIAPALADQGSAGRRARAADYRSEIHKYRADREASLRADDSWLTVAGLFWLKPGPNVAGSAPGSDIVLPRKAPARLGVFELRDGRVTFVADTAAHVTMAGKRVGATAVVAPESDDDALVAGDLSMFVIRREDRYGIRLRDVNSAMRRAFKGLQFYPVREAYRVTARFVPYDKPRTIAVPNVLGQAPEMESPGYVTFTLNGRELRLEPVYETSEKTDLFFIFKDLTSRDATYPAGRFLHAPLPKDGTVTIDFNKAYNPPCAFTDFATCPLPPKQNHLPIRIEAGELAYHGPTSRPKSPIQP